MNQRACVIFHLFTTVPATRTNTTLMCAHTYTLSSYKALQPQKAAVLWQLRQVILSREECHCNPLMLLSHPQRVWVSVPALIYIDSGWRKWSLSLWLYEAWTWERERGGARCSSRHHINAFTMLLQCQPGGDISVISQSVCDVCLCSPSHSP